MLPDVSKRLLESLTVKELEELLELKKKNVKLTDLLKERDRLRLELRRVEDSIETMEKLSAAEPTPRPQGSGARPASMSFLSGKHKRNLKDYIAQVLLESGEPLAPAEIQRRLPNAGYASSSTNPRSIYNTIFQALQRYDAFLREGKKYRLREGIVKSHERIGAILPKKKTRLKDYIVDVLTRADGPLKASEIASRVIIAGYPTDLEMEDLNQRVSATLKKYLNKDFEWDSQRYRLVSRN